MWFDAHGYVLIMLSIYFIMALMKKDMLFSSKVFEEGEFVFNQSVVDVFDDMVSRSVPHYLELQHVLVQVVLQKFSYKDEIKVFDLGCSTGTLGCVFSEMMERTNIVKYGLGLGS